MTPSGPIPCVASAQVTISSESSRITMRPLYLSWNTSEKPVTGSFTLSVLIDDADRPLHVGHAVLEFGIVRLIPVLLPDVLQVGDLGVVERDELVLLHQRLDHVLGGLDQVVARRARHQLREHLLVGRVALVVHLDSGLLGEIVENGLRHVLRPREEIQLFGGRGAQRCGEPRRQRQGEERCELPSETWILLRGFMDCGAAPLR